MDQLLKKINKYEKIYSKINYLISSRNKRPYDEFFDKIDMKLNKYITFNRQNIEPQIVFDNNNGSFTIAKKHKNNIIQPLTPISAIPIVDTSVPAFFRPPPTEYELKAPTPSILMGNTIVPISALEQNNAFKVNENNEKVIHMASRNFPFKIDIEN